MQKEKIQKNAEDAFYNIVSQLPYNRSSVYVKIHLENSKCDLYLPYRDRNVENASEWSKGIKVLTEILKL